MFGSSVIDPLKNSTSHGKSIVWQELNLSETKGGYVIIATSTKDLSELIRKRSVILIDGMAGCQDDNETSTTKYMSGYVVLGIMHLDKSMDKSGLQWGIDQYNIIKSCKKNIMTAANNHHGSCGEYFSWGNKGNCGMQNNSSVRSYVNKPGLKSSLTSTFIEQMINTELQMSVLKIGKILPSMRNVIAPVIQVAHDIQSNSTNINITERYGSNVGIWQSSVSVNAVIKDLHTEDDVTYTTITVPRQKTKNIDRHFHFIYLATNAM